MGDIKVLIIDDSPVARSLLKFMIESEAGMSVIGTVAGGEEALQFLKENRPDVITTDMNMPKMDGLATIQQILRRYPIPILVVSGSCKVADQEKVFQALSAGALALLAKPAGIKDPNFDQVRRELIEMLKIMSEVKVVRRLYKNVAGPQVKSISSQIATEEFGIVKVRPHTASVRAVGIGASTGGPQALQKLISELPSDFPVPIFVVQHIAPGFLQSLVSWLNQSSALRVRVGIENEYAAPGNVYFAPDHYHMEINSDNQILLSPPSDNQERTCPSISRLFQSMANAHGPHSIGVLLTGMGKDGAEELLLMKQKGAYTIAQDEDSSVVFGMPREAILLGAAIRILSLEHIAETLKELIS